jgi:hypothetical protein
VFSAAQSETSSPNLLSRSKVSRLDLVSVE